jgi:hypothetical protein
MRKATHFVVLGHKCRALFQDGKIVFTSDSDLFSGLVTKYVSNETVV